MLIIQKCKELYGFVTDTQIQDVQMQARQTMVRSILITTIVMALFWMYYPPRFVETNDDVVMASILYGYNGEYDGHMYFINICLGMMLETCVRALPMIPWYTVAQVGTIYLSFIVVVYLLLQRFKGSRSILPIVLLFAFFGFDSFCSLQFTKTAAIGVIGGLLLAFYAVKNCSKWPTYLFAFYLSLMGSFFRFDVFKMMLAFFAIIGLCMVNHHLKNREWRNMIRLCLPFVLIIGLCFSGNYIHRYYYTHHEDWKEFAQYNVLRAELIDKGFPDYDENIDLYNSLNITSNDLVLYQDGNYADPELYTSEVIAALAAAKEPKVIDIQLIKEFNGTVIRSLIKYSFFPALCIAFIAAFLSVNKTNKSFLIIARYEAIIFLAVQLYFFYSSRYLQLRVDMGIILAVFLILFLHSTDPDVVLPSKAKTSLLVSLGLLFTTVSYHVTKYENGKDQLEKVENTQIVELLMSDPDHYYFYPNLWSVFPDKMYDVFTVEPFGCGNNRSILGTWRSQTPPIIEKWGRHGITNPYRDMTDRSDIYLLCTSNSARDRVLSHIREHYYENAVCNLVKDIEGIYQVYRVSTSNTPDIDTSKAIDGSQILEYDVSYTVDKEKLIISGHLYEQGKNSYASNIYIGITGQDNEEQLYYATQQNEKGYTDYMNGSYGSFYKKINLPVGENVIRYYLEVDGTLYYVQPKSDPILFTKAGIVTKTIDLLPYMTEFYDCQIAETHQGIVVFNTGIDAQMCFTVPEMDGLMVAGVSVKMDTGASSYAQLFVETKTTGYSEKQSSGIKYSPGSVSLVLGSPSRQPISLRFDPTMLEGQTINLRSLQLLLID